MFSDHSGIKLEISYRNIIGKSPNTWKLNNILLKNLWAKEEVSRERNNYIELDENEKKT